MARTKQTARKSTGGFAPSRHHIVSNDNEENQNLLVNIFNSTDTRTIAVDGEDSFDIIPDEVKLSFKVSDESRDFHEAMQLTLFKLSQVRSKIISLGISNDKISSDSLSIDERIVIIRNGNQIDSNEHDEDDEENKDVEIEKFVVYTAIIIARIQLEQETTKLFGKLMLEMLDIGIYTHAAPLYTTSKLTEYRNESRRNAIENASMKATLLLEGLNRSDIQLGLPITINDIPQNITDDSYQSFSGNTRPWFSKIIASTKTSISTTNINDQEEQVTKKRRLDDYMNDLFVMPNLTINACVKVIFEILFIESEDDKELSAISNQQIDETK